MQEAQELATDLPEGRATVWSFSVRTWRRTTTTGAMARAAGARREKCNFVGETPTPGYFWRPGTGR